MIFYIFDTFSRDGSHFFLMLVDGLGVQISTWLVNLTIIMNALKCRILGTEMLL